MAAGRLRYVPATVLLAFSVLYQGNYRTAPIFQTNANVPGATAFDPQEPPIVAALLADLS